MRDLSSVVLKLFFVALSVLSTLTASPLEGPIIDFTGSCNQCHGFGNSPAVPAAQGFSVVDPMTNQSVSAYVPGRVYRLEIRFGNNYTTPIIENAYRLKIHDGNNLRAGAIVSTTGIGTVSQTAAPAPQINARVITSTDRQLANNASLLWAAPQAGQVSFELYRMESNNNASPDFGDRVSQAKEIFTVVQASQNQPIVTLGAGNPPVIDESVTASFSLSTVGNDSGDEVLESEIQLSGATDNCQASIQSDPPRIEVTGCSGNGNITVSVQEGAIQNLSGSSSPAVSQTVLVDNTEESPQDPSTPPQTFDSTSQTGGCGTIRSSFGGSQGAKLSLLIALLATLFIVLRRACIQVRST